MKRSEKSEASRSQIILGAIKEFGINGYRQGSTNGICEACGISKGLIFYHFSSKEQLFKEAAKLCIQEFDLYMREHFVKGNVPIEGIRSCCHARKTFFTQHPYYHKIFCDVLYVGDVHASEMEELRQMYEAHSYGIIDRILEDVEMNTNNSRSANIWMAVRLIEFIDMALGQQYQDSKKEELLEEQMNQYEGYLEALLYGILKR